MLYIIDEVLEEMALENISHFSPHYICNRANIPDLKAVTEYLLQFVGIKLYVFYEVECPEGDSDFAITSPQDLPQEQRRCHICQTVYLPDIDRVWIAFDFIPHFKEHVKKKRIFKQKKQRQHLMLV